MIRYILFSLTLLCLHLSSVSEMLGAQEQAKPIYRIEARREGERIGEITLELFPLIAPKAVHYFDSLVTIKFYDSTAFHRVIPGFMIQGGDPNSRTSPRDTWGYGNPNQQTVEAEFSKVEYVRGILGAARSDDPNSATSQFFICVATASHLNGNYTVYGKAIAGMNIADSIVRSPRDSKDNPLAKIEMFITKVGENDSIPSAPALKSPQNNAGQQGISVTLSWQPVYGAVLYQAEVAEDSTFSSPLFSDVSGSTSILANGLTLGTNTYYWRVRANNGGHLSPYSAVRSFTTSINNPVPAYPDSGYVAPDTTLRLGWNAVKGAIAYHLQVATNTFFSSSALVFEQKSVKDTSIEVSALAKGKRYFWRVSALTSEYEGGYSAPRPFQTPAIVSVTESTPSLALPTIQIYPHPLHSSADVHYYRNESGLVRLRILDLTGRELMCLANEQQEKGEYHIALDASALANGVYIAEIQGTSHGIPQRALFVVQH